MVRKRHSSTFSLSSTMMFVVKGQGQEADFAILVLITLIADRSPALLCLTSSDRCPTQLQRRGILHESLPSDSAPSWPLICTIATALPMSHPPAVTRVTSQPWLFLLHSLSRGCELRAWERKLVFVFGIQHEVLRYGLIHSCRPEETRTSHSSVLVPPCWPRPLCDRITNRTFPFSPDACSEFAGPSNHPLRSKN